jgi:hypothetical protein
LARGTSGTAGEPWTPTNDQVTQPRVRLASQEIVTKLPTKDRKNSFIQLHNKEWALSGGKKLRRAFPRPLGEQRVHAAMSPGHCASKLGVLICKE